MQPVESTLAKDQFPPLGLVLVQVRQRGSGRVVVPVGDGFTSMDVEGDGLVNRNGQCWLKGQLIERMKQEGRYGYFRLYGQVAVGDLRLEVPLKHLQAA